MFAITVNAILNFMPDFPLPGFVGLVAIQTYLLPLFFAFASAFGCLLVIIFLPFWIHLFRNLLRSLLSHFNVRIFATNESWEETLARTGFAYDPRQDIFYSLMNPWQRRFGYCRLYDEASAPLTMIIDCEPIRFEYANKKWLIEFWKGQYGMTTGGEVGVFNTDEDDLDIPQFFTGTFYNSVENEDLLPISFTLLKNNKPLFTRAGRHWWMTGFVLGAFSEPTELKMDIRLSFKDRAMMTAFVNALKLAGYTYKEFSQSGTQVRITYGKPHTAQPISRTAATDYLIQQKNKLLCDEYMDLTAGYATTPEKIQFVQSRSPKLYKKIMNMGRTKPMFSHYKKIQKHMNKLKQRS